MGICKSKCQKKFSVMVNSMTNTVTGTEEEEERKKYLNECLTKCSKFSQSMYPVCAYSCNSMFGPKAAANDVKKFAVQAPMSLQGPIDWKKKACELGCKQLAENLVSGCINACLKKIVKKDATSVQGIDWRTQAAKAACYFTCKNFSLSTDQVNECRAKCDKQFNPQPKDTSVEFNSETIMTPSLITESLKILEGKQ